MCKNLNNGMCDKAKNFYCPFTRKGAFEPINTMQDCVDFER